MKFCKDCKHHIRESYADGGTLLPGFAMYLPAACNAPQVGTRTDLVSGEIRSLSLHCKDARADEEKCGQSGAWFEPGTLDGRLAMLESD